MNTRPPNIRLEPIESMADHIDILFDLFKKRNHRISGNPDTSFAEHQAFVTNHPYRAWFFIIRNDEVVGSIYVGKDNGIGVDLSESELDLLNPVILKLIAAVRPNPGIPSLRNKEFFINVSASDLPKIRALESIGCSKIQETFRFPDFSS